MTFQQRLNIDYFIIGYSVEISECLISPPVLPVQDIANTEIRATIRKEYLNHEGKTSLLLKNLKAARPDTPRTRIIMRDIYQKVSWLSIKSLLTPGNTDFKYSEDGSPVKKTGIVTSAAAAKSQRYTLTNFSFLKITACAMRKNRTIIPKIGRWLNIR